LRKPTPDTCSKSYIGWTFLNALSNRMASSEATVDCSVYP